MFSIDGTLVGLHFEAWFLWIWESLRFLVRLGCGRLPFFRSLRRAWHHFVGHHTTISQEWDCTCHWYMSGILSICSWARFLSAHFVLFYLPDCNWDRRRYCDIWAHCTKMSAQLKICSVVSNRIHRWKLRNSCWFVLLLLIPLARFACFCSCLRQIRWRIAFGIAYLAAWPIASLLVEHKSFGLSAQQCLDPDFHFIDVLSICSKMRECHHLFHRSFSFWQIWIVTNLDFDEK